MISVELSVRNVTIKKLFLLLTPLGFRGKKIYMANKKYWQNFSEYNESEQFSKLSADEFREDLPVVTPGAEKEFEDSGSSRRDFLKYLGFSTAAAALAASCETPVKKAIPFVNKPENLVPGIADYLCYYICFRRRIVPLLPK